MAVAPTGQASSCELSPTGGVCGLKKGVLTTTLLVLLVGEMLTPFQGDFRSALPQAFPEGVPEVGLGTSAPPGRTVAWITVQGSGLELEVVLHTARIPGDLRRVLRFTGDDAPKDRARAAAFTLAAMVRERDADLKALEPPKVEVAASLPPAPLPTPWLLDASVLVGFDLPSLNAGAGPGARLRRELTSWLQLGAGLEVGFFSTPATTLIQPTFFVEAAVPLTKGTFSTALVLGGGVAAAILSREKTNLTTWLPLLRVAAEGRFALGPHHGFRFALSTHFVSHPLTVRVGTLEMPKEIGPAWLRPEIGYFVEL